MTKIGTQVPAVSTLPKVGPAANLVPVAKPELVASTVQPNSSLAQHIAFFETLNKDGSKSGVVQTGGTRDGLKALGIRGLSVPFGGLALTAPFSIRMNKSLFANKVHMDKIGDMVRADGTDTGVYKKDGSLDVDAFKNFWQGTAGKKGYITDADVTQLTAKKPVSALEFCLLMELAGQINTKGERVLTLDTMVAFYDGSLFADLAKARESGTLYQPTGAVAHDGLKKVAKGLSSQALQLGGKDAGEGAKAIGAGTMTIDDAASLEYQQKSKTLGSTLAGAFKALCPAGKG